MPGVSVVITSYNYGRFLGECVGSVLGQTYRDFEIIIVNDGSSDDTADVAGRIISGNPGTDIRLIDQPNSGVATARNNGIRAAAGEYIMTLDADDMVKPGFIETVMGELDADPSLSFAYTQIERFGDVSEEFRHMNPPRDFDFDRLLYENIVPSCCIFRKSAWAEVGGFKNMPVEDWEFWLSIAEAGHKGMFIDKDLFLYRVHGPSRSLDNERMKRRYHHRVKLLHSGSYHPVAARISPTLARMLLYLDLLARDPVAHFLFRKAPRLHALLRKLRGGLFGPRPGSEGRSSRKGAKA